MAWHGLALNLPHNDCPERMEYRIPGLEIRMNVYI